MLPVNLLRAFWQSAARAARSRGRRSCSAWAATSPFPGGMMAALLGMPLVLHEQNSVAGLANRVLARVADRVLVAFPDALPGASGAAIRCAPTSPRSPPPEQRFAGREGALRLLVVGGSLGAQALNDDRADGAGAAGARRAAAWSRTRAARPTARRSRPITGRPACEADAGRLHRRHGGRLRRGRPGGLPRRRDDGARSWRRRAWRACWFRIPHAVDDHQTANARFLSERGAALLVPQRRARRRSGSPQLLDGPRSREHLLAMAQRAREAARPDASARSRRRLRGDRRGDRMKHKVNAHPLRRHRRRRHERHRRGAAEPRLPGQRLRHRRATPPRGASPSSARA